MFYDSKKNLIKKIHQQSREGKTKENEERAFELHRKPEKEQWRRKTKKWFTLKHWKEIGKNIAGRKGISKKGKQCKEKTMKNENCEGINARKSPEKKKGKKIIVQGRNTMSQMRDKGKKVPVHKRMM